MDDLRFCVTPRENDVQPVGMTQPYWPIQPAVSVPKIYGKMVPYDTLW